MSRALRWLGWTLGLLVGAVFFITLGHPWMITGPFHLVAGWALFLGETFPGISWRWGGIAEALGVMGVLGVGTHLFMSWLWLHVQGEEASARPWPVRWTVSGVALLVLLFCATMATVGLGHHMGWLATSREPLLVSSWRFQPPTEDGGNERLCEYALVLARSGVPNGQLMQELLRNTNTQDLAERLVVLPWRSGEGKSGFLVFSRDPLTRANSGGARCGDGLEQSEWVDTDQLSKVLAEQGLSTEPAP